MMEDEVIIVKEIVPIITKEIKVILNKEAMVKEVKEVIAKKIQLTINKDKVVLVKVIKEVGELNMGTMEKIKEINIHQIFQNKINFNEVFVEIFNIIKYVNFHKLENAQEFMDLILNKRFIE